MEQEIIKIIKDNGLSVTEPRKKVLELFFAAEDALDHANIERGAEGVDRVTIYRTLQAFTERGIIHTIPTDDNSIKYALCKECGKGNHHHNHVHFLCELCGKTTCIEKVVVPQISLPKRYTVYETSVVIKGKCEECNNVSRIKNNDFNKKLLA